jgi:hypothetical protein
VQSRGMSLSLVLSVVLLSPIVLGGCDSDCVVGAPLDAGPGQDGPALTDADGPPPGWAISLGGAGDEELSRIVLDPAGDLILLGRYTGALELETLSGPITLPASGAVGRTFLAKLDPQARKLRWALSLDGVPVRNLDLGEGYQEQGTDGLGVDGAGNIYVAGRFRRSATFGATTLVSAGGLDIFVLKLDPAGKPLWAVSAGGPGDDDAEDLALGPRDVLMICGLFSSTATFGQTTLSAAGLNDLFVARLDAADGRFVWAVRAGSDSTTVKREWASGIALDPAGNAHIVGGVAGTAIFETKYGTRVMWGSDSDQVAYLVRLDPAGRFYDPWAPAARQLDAIRAGPSGVRHVAGGFGALPQEVDPFGDTTVVVYQCEVNCDLHQATASTSTNGHMRVRGAAGDGRGNTVIVGSFFGTASFGAKTLALRGAGGNGFLARMSPIYGEGFVEARSMFAVDTKGGSFAAGLAVDRLGGIYVVGMFSGTIDFGRHLLSSHERTGFPDTFDAFIWYTGRGED